MTRKSAQYSKRNDKPRPDAAQRIQALVKRVRWIILGFGALAVVQSAISIVNSPEWNSWTWQEKSLTVGAVVVSVGVLFAVVYFLLVFIVRRYFSRFLQ